jgi:hypothetical protein
MNILLKSLAALALCVTESLAQAPASREPDELVRLRNAYNQKRADVLKPIEAGYRQQLEMLVRSLTSRNQLDAAILVRKELETLTSSGVDEAPLKRALLESKWSWALLKDKDDGSVQLTFLEDGTVSHRAMRGTWKIIGPRELKLVEGGHERILQPGYAVHSLNYHLLWIASLWAVAPPTRSLPLTGGKATACCSSR